MTILVGPTAEAGRLAAAHHPSHVVALASPGQERPPIPTRDRARHLALTFHDIAGPRPGLRPPSREDVAALLALGRDWDGRRPFLVHCEAGVSRSPAAAFALLCQALPGHDEATLALRLRETAPIATPNPLLVALADELLGRAGRMVAAVASIGRGADWRPHRGFVLTHPDLARFRAPA